MIGILALSYLVAINLLTWWLFSIDKKRAIRKDWRIPEKTLISAAVFGGWPAAKLAQRLLRHKNRKQPFAEKLNAVPVIWMGMVIAGLAFAAYVTMT